MNPIDLPDWYTFFVQCSECQFKFTKPVNKLIHVVDFLCPNCGRNIKLTIEEGREDARVRFEKMATSFMQDEINRQLKDG